MATSTASFAIFMRAVAVLSAALIVSSAPGQTQQSNPTTAAAPRAKAQTFAAAKPIRAVFTCDAGKTVDATFINGAQSSVELTLSDGRKLALPQAMSGSGARYANGDESVVFWNKGNTAFIEESGKTTYSNCTTGR